MFSNKLPTSCLQPPWLLRRGIDQQSCDQCACQEPLWTVEVIVQVHRAQGYFRVYTATNDPKPGLARQQDRGGSRMMPSVVEKPALKQQFSKEASWDWTNSYIIGPLWGESTNHWRIHITKSQWYTDLMFSLLMTWTSFWTKGLSYQWFKTPWSPIHNRNGGSNKHSLTQ